MSLTEIEAALEKLTNDELRSLAVKSWSAFVAREDPATHACDEEDSTLLAGLDEAVSRAEATPQQGLSAQEVRSHLDQWTSR